MPPKRTEPLVHGTIEMYRSGSCRCIDCKRAAREHRQINHGRIIEIERKYDRANKTKRKANLRQWQINNPERVKDYHHGRSILEKGGNVSSRDWNRLCGRYNNCCAYCGDRTQLTQDHVVPLSRGGKHTIGNILPACLPCNSSKHARFLVDWGRKFKIEVA